MRSDTRRNAGRVIPLTLLGAALVLLFSLGGLADEARAATTWTARAGEFVPPEALEIQTFLPSDITVVEGDTIDWNIIGLHTVTQPAGPPNLVFNPEILAPSGGDTYSGSGFFNSGLLLGREGPPGAPTSYSLKFDAPGTFDYICLVHGPLMTGTITVSAGLPSVGGFAPTPLMGVFAGLIGLGMVAGGGLLVARRIRST